MEVSIHGPRLAVETCARRLRGFGARPQGAIRPAGDAATATLSLEPDGPAEEPLEVRVSWHGPARLGERPGSEVTVQALSGLMQVHGRDAGAPRRLGLEAASVAAGVLAAQAVLATAAARGRGRVIRETETSVLEAALVLTSHYVAAATCADRGEWSPPAVPRGPGPPFVSVDGRRFEIETLDHRAWRDFWSRLGAADADLALAWAPFRARYFQGRCTLPEALHRITGSRTLEAVTAAAAAAGVSLVPLRSYPEVLADPAAAVERAVLTPLDAAPAAVPPPAPRPGGLPLEGVVVVEATSRMQGPLAGLLLRMLGARVIRVEPPGGDPIRLVPPYSGEDGYFFASFNHGKEAVELDLASPGDRDALRDLVAGADVFLQNWAPRTAARWELGPEQLAPLNPALVYVQATGWGASGPPGAATGRPVGTDFLVQAWSGMGDGLEPEAAGPAPSRVLLTDCLGALVTCEGALAGLHRRQATGTAHRVGASLLAGAMALQAHVLDALRAGREQGRRGGRPVWGPLDVPLPAAQGYVAVDAGPEDGDRLRRLCRACGVEAQPGSAEVGRRIARRIAERPAAAWEDELGAAGVPCAAVSTDLAALAADPRLVALFEELAGGCRVPAKPWRLAG